MLYAKSVQRYCFFLIQPSFLAKKCQNLQICIILVQIFRNSAFFCANLQVVRCTISTEGRTGGGALFFEERPDYIRRNRRRKAGLTVRAKKENYAGG